MVLAFKTRLSAATETGSIVISLARINHSQLGSQAVQPAHSMLRQAFACRHQEVSSRTGRCSARPGDHRSKDHQHLSSLQRIRMTSSRTPAQAALIILILGWMTGWLAGWPAN